MDQKIRTQRIQKLLLVPFSVIWFIFLIGFFTNKKVSNESITGFGIVSFGIIMLLVKIFRGNNKYGEVLGLLHYYCSPDVFIIAVREMLKKEEEKEHPKEKNRLLLYMSNGLYAAGRFQEAMETLKKIELFYHHKNAAFIANCFHRQCLIALEMERQDIAWGSLVQMKEAISYIRKYKIQRFFSTIYTEDMHMLNIARGDYGNAEHIFYEMFQRGKSNYERSFASFLLGGVYKYLGKDAEAKDAYEYVLEWGNKLYIANKAAEYLGLKNGAA